MKLTQITLDPQGDGYYLLFVNQELWQQGDDYHDKLNDKIEGIIDFLKFIKIEPSFEEIKLTHKNDNKSYYDADYNKGKDENLDKYLKRLRKIGFINYESN